MGWKNWLVLWPRRARPVPRHSAEDPPTDDLAKARVVRADAERKLQETRARGPEVTSVARTSVRIRQENQFSARWGEVFRGNSG